MLSEQPVFHCYGAEGFAPIPVAPTTITVEHFCRYTSWIASNPAIYNTIYLAACAIGTVYEWSPVFGTACDQLAPEGFSTMGADGDNWLDEGPEPFDCLHQAGRFSLNCGFTFCVGDLVPPDGSEERAAFGAIMAAYVCNQGPVCSLGPTGEALDGGPDGSLRDLAPAWPGYRNRQPGDCHPEQTIDKDWCLPVRFAISRVYRVVDAHYPYLAWNAWDGTPTHCFPPPPECTRPVVVVLVRDECLESLLEQ